MSLYLCVDCGGSKTSAVICSSSGQIVGRALGGPSNVAYLGVNAFIAAVRQTVGDALKACDLPVSVLNSPAELPTPIVDPSPFNAAWFGISGVDSPAVVATLTPILSALLGIPPGSRLAIANDTHLLAAPVRMHSDVSYAVAVIGGTGSISVAFKEDAAKDNSLIELGRVGGWGWILGDEGGGFHVGREAIRQILITHDRSSVGGSSPPESTLTTKILKTFRVGHVLDILSVVHLPDPSPDLQVNADTPPYILLPREKRLSSLSPIVFEAAFEDHDALALSVLQSCADTLASQVAELLVECVDVPDRTVRAAESVISFGGSLVGIDKYRAMVLAALEKRGHVFKYVEVIDDAAAVGAAGLVAAHADRKE